ncbi:divalent ion tolerance protein CutA [Ignicoccus pacificus DSM 13166]|uniref:Divalent ion tolerance protein CutA n=1 Tax=Ignicoccus pacificus DSM 13166 TaxID=940294 RepID=A0A977PJW3_9CREN|nr:divalent ion tolerance protein CutA [Ignicoccus pacificus DSM 13166]
MLYVIFSTFPDEESAEKVAKEAIAKRLAACIWIVPGIKSYYIWKNEMQEDKEVLLVAKVPEEKVDELTEFVRKNHPYEVPEIIGVKADRVLPEYLKWAKEVCQGEG